MSLDLKDDELESELPELLAGYIATAIRDNNLRLGKSIKRARNRLHFTLKQHSDN